MAVTENQIIEIFAKRPERRYKYFIKTVTDEEEVWGLIDEEGWLMLDDPDDESSAIVVFPSQEFAVNFIRTCELTGYRADLIDLTEFLTWFEDFEKEKINIAVFPSPDFQCAVMPPNRLKDDIQSILDSETE